MHANMHFQIRINAPENPDEKASTVSPLEIIFQGPAVQCAFNLSQSFVMRLAHHEPRVELRHNDNVQLKQFNDVLTFALQQYAKATLPFFDVLRTARLCCASPVAHEELSNMLRNYNGIVSGTLRYGNSDAVSIIHAFVDNFCELLTKIEHEQDLQTFLGVGPDVIARHPSLNQLYAGRLRVFFTKKQYYKSLRAFVMRSPYDVLSRAAWFLEGEPVRAVFRLRVVSAWGYINMHPGLEFVFKDNHLQIYCARRFDMQSDMICDISGCTFETRPPTALILRDPHNTQYVSEADDIAWVAGGQNSNLLPWAGRKSIMHQNFGLPEEYISPINEFIPSRDVSALVANYIGDGAVFRTLTFRFYSYQYPSFLHVPEFKRVCTYKIVLRGMANTYHDESFQFIESRVSSSVCHRHPEERCRFFPRCNIDIDEAWSYVLEFMWEYAQMVLPYFRLLTCIQEALEYDESGKEIIQLADSISRNVSLIVHGTNSPQSIELVVDDLKVLLTLLDLTTNRTVHNVAAEFKAEWGGRDDFLIRQLRFFEDHVGLEKFLLACTWKTTTNGRLTGTWKLPREVSGQDDENGLTVRLDTGVMWVKMIGFSEMIALGDAQATISGESSAPVFIDNTQEEVDAPLFNNGFQPDYDEKNMGRVKRGRDREEFEERDLAEAQRQSREDAEREQERRNMYPNYAVAESSSAPFLRSSSSSSSSSSRNPTTGEAGRQKPRQNCHARCTGCYVCDSIPDDGYGYWCN